MRILRRTTVIISDSSQNFRLGELQEKCDILALRPTDSQTFGQCCSSQDGDIVSLDLSTRHYYRLKHSTISTAVQHGKKIELCYGSGLVGGDPLARRNLIQNAVDLIRRTRGGRGIIISSEAQSALGCRGPFDVINLAVVWGLGQEKAHEAITTEARKCVNGAKLKRSSYRGAIDVIYGGEKPEKPAPQGKGNNNGRKRKAEEQEDSGEKPMSKRQQKRQAHEARMKAQTEAKAAKAASTPSPLPANEGQSGAEKPSVQG